MSFFVTLQSNFQHVMLYESPELQQKARNVIPLPQLSSAAKDKLKEAKVADPGEMSFLSAEDTVPHMSRRVVITGR